MDRSISIAVGRPLGIQDTDITMPLPLCLTDGMLPARDRAGSSASGGDMSFVSVMPDPSDHSTFPVCMNQTPTWFQIAYHQAIMNLYRPSHASPLCTIDAIRLCVDSSISLMANYSALYAKKRITYTFVALTSLFMAAVTMLYCFRASTTLRSELTRDVVE